MTSDLARSLDMSPKATKDKMTNDCIKIKNFYTPKDTAKKSKNIPQNGGNYLQIIYLIKDFYLGYIKTCTIQQ